ncbi:hypothetical protein BYT27DRAFT_7255439 [Phlegmacium glaucopus]|nr:hypothetical protein BYT27DRAFT_7255439 [Phlegmacium glaucopus]
MPKNSSTTSRSRLRQQYGSQYIPDSNPSSPREAQSESDSEVLSFSSSQVESSIIEEHEIPVPLQAQPEFETQYTNTFTLPSAVRDFWDMFEGRSYMSDKDLSQIPEVLPVQDGTTHEFLDMFEGCSEVFDEDFSQIPLEVLVADGTTSFEGYKIGVAESELRGQEVEKPIVLAGSLCTPVVLADSSRIPTNSRYILNNTHHELVHSKGLENDAKPGSKTCRAIVKGASCD